MDLTSLAPTVREIDDRLVLEWGGDTPPTIGITPELFSQFVMDVNTARDERDNLGRANALSLAFEFASVWLFKMREAGLLTDPTSHLKLLHEARELADAPNLAEAADVLIALAATCVEQHWSLADLAEAVQAKATVNKTRRWERLPDGTLQHIQGEQS